MASADAELADERLLPDPLLGLGQEPLLLATLEARHDRRAAHHEEQRDEHGDEDVGRDAHKPDVEPHVVAHGRRERVLAAVGVEDVERLEVIVGEAHTRVVLRERLVRARARARARGRVGQPGGRVD